MNITILFIEGDLEVKPWSTRAPGAQRSRIVHTNLALYTLLPLAAKAEVSVIRQENPCLCCNEILEPKRNSYEPRIPSVKDKIPQIYK